MSMDKIFGVAGSALAAQLVRMNTTASNLANSSNTAPSEEEAYRAKRVVFRTLLSDQTIGDQTRYAGSIQVPNITDDPTLLNLMTRETHQRTRTATFTRVMNEVSEMVEMTAAARSYQNNIEVINTAKQMMMKTLEVIKA